MPCHPASGTGIPLISSYEGGSVLLQIAAAKRNPNLQIREGICNTLVEPYFLGNLHFKKLCGLQDAPDSTPFRRPVWWNAGPSSR